MSGIGQTVSNLDAWLDTMRGPDGYGGPVVHWWQNCLSFTGAALDWRYEGIIHGYLALWRRTGQQVWLDKAIRAGNDLVMGQLSSGNYRCSSFELNPYAGGTSHEAAVDLALINLARSLKSVGDDRWQAFAETAERNLRYYYFDRLWDKDAQSFRDNPNLPSLVPNKVCTLAEALFAAADLRGNDELVIRVALPALRSVVILQVQEEGPLRGAIAQNHIQGAIVEAYFPYYVARCIPAFLVAFEHTGDTAWVDAALEAGRFIAKHIDDQGRLPQVIYRHGINRYPQWIAALGDVLRALSMLVEFGLDFDKGAVDISLLHGRLSSGGFATATGFGSQISQNKPDDHLPDFRDNIPVVGWCDKAFAYLAAQVPDGQALPPARITDVTLECQIREQPATWQETTTEMKLVAGDRTLYHWDKRASWAAVVVPEAMWK